MGTRPAGENRNPEDHLRRPVDPDSAAYGEKVRVLLHGKRHRKYRILFAIRGDMVLILTVRHTSRQSLSEEIGLDEDEAGQPL